MCVANLFSAPPAPQVIPAPTKTSQDTQNSEEAQRSRMALSTRGIGATILTSGLGASTAPKVSGVTLGV